MALGHCGLPHVLDPHPVWREVYDKLPGGTVLLTREAVRLGCGHFFPREPPQAEEAVTANAQGHPKTLPRTMDKVPFHRIA